MTGRRSFAGALLAVLAGWPGAGCGDRGHTPPTVVSVPVDIARASALLDVSAMLPERAETVALADAVAVASAKEGKTAEGARLARLAADLRVRLWRLDRTTGDGREALELYAAAVAASAPEQACTIDTTRALFAGELTADAATTYRELFIARKRAEATAAPCVPDLDTKLARAVAFRPEGEGMRALERDASAAVENLGRERGAPAASGATAAASTASASPVASAAPGSATVVSPNEERVGTKPVRLTSVERFGGQEGARIVLHVSGPTTFQVGTAAAEAGKDARVFVDLAHATARGLAREVEIGGIVRRVRLGAHPSGTRVVLDLAGVAYRRVFYLPEPFRVVIDVSTRPPARAESVAAGAPREVRRVVVDPGHGGTDAGAIGPTGLREKDVTLDIAHRLAPLLAHELKVETLLTRDDDTFVPLELRTARANAFHADLFVSIHCNASENPAARGAQTYILDEARDPEGFASRVAARENAQRGRVQSRGSLDELTAIALQMNPIEMRARSRHVADLLQRSVLASLTGRYADTRDQGVKTAGFFVLVGADMPAVLFETAFISNTEDESRLATADYRQKLADALLNAVRAYKSGK